MITNINVAKETTQSEKAVLQYRLPQQFKPDRLVEEGAFFSWVSLGMKFVPSLTRKDLDPTEADLKLISTLAYQTDDLANALADEIFKNRLVAKQLEEGLVNGVASLENPPQVLVDYLHYYEALPAYLESIGLSDEMDEKKVLPNKKRPSRISQVLNDGVSMSAGFFVGANFPAVGQSIVSTGSVASGTSRMLQSLQFVKDVAQPNAFKAHGVGIQACAKVRLAHAFARKQIARKNNWDEDYYGVAISEFDNMIFLSGIFMTLVLRPELKSSLAEAKIRGIQYGLGAPKELLTLSPMEIFRFFNMVLAHLDDSPETARQVVKNFHENDYFRDTETFQGKMDRELSLQVANLNSRIFYGNKMADDIGLGRWYRGVYLPLLALFFRQLTIVSIGRIDSLIKIAKLTRKITKKVSKKNQSTNSSSTNNSLKPENKSIAGYKGSFGVFKGKENSAEL